MDSMKMLIKIRGERHAQFQNAMDSVKNTMKMENKRRGLDGFNEDEYGENTFDVYETDGAHLTSKEPPVWMREPRKTCPVASTSTAKKSSDQQGLDGSGAAPKCQGSDSQFRYSKQHEAQAWWGRLCEDIYIEPQARLEQHAGQDQHMKGDIGDGGGHKNTENASA